MMSRDPIPDPRAVHRRRTDPRWAAVGRAMREADDTVLLRGAHHRRVLPALLPLAPRQARERVVLRSCDAAERPAFVPANAAGREVPRSPTAARPTVAQICDYIERAEHTPRLAELAERAGMSPYHFHRVFKATTGLSPKAYATAHRARRVRGELKRAAVGDAGHHGRRLQLGRALLRRSNHAAGHDAAPVPRRRRRYPDPFCDRPTVRSARSWWRAAPRDCAPSCSAMIRTQLTRELRSAFRPRALVARRCALRATGGRGDPLRRCARVSD